MGRRAAAARVPRHRRLVEQLLDFLVPRVIYFYARWWHRCERRGANPVPARGAALVVSNHPCHADAAFLIAASERWIHFLQSREHYDVFGLRFLFRLFGCIPVTLGRPNLRGIRLALKRLQGGAVIGLFAEGDLTPPGAVGPRPGRAGAALLALRSGAPVIPAFLLGGPPARGPFADWIHRAPGVRVVFGPPIDLSAYQDRPITHARLQEVTRLFMQRIADLQPPCAQAAQGTYRMTALEKNGSSTHNGVLNGPVPSAPGRL